MGVTSVRDPGNDDSLTIDRRERVGEGRAADAARLPVVAHRRQGSEHGAGGERRDQRRRRPSRWSTRRRQNGFTGVKFYGTLNPAWLPAAAAEAHKLGLHVHGHIPQGIRPLEAINAGYDEITHINWIMMQAMPDAVIQVTTASCASKVRAVTRRTSISNGEAITKIIVDDGGEGDLQRSDHGRVRRACTCRRTATCRRAYAPFVGTLPPTTERGFRTGGFAVPKDLTRADYRASWAKMVALLGKMHKAGVPDRRGHRRRGHRAGPRARDLRRRRA